MRHTPRRRRAVTAAAAVVAFSIVTHTTARPAAGYTRYDWASPVSGSYTDPLRWIPASVPEPVTAGAFFNQNAAAPYTVSFTASRSAAIAQVEADQLLFAVGAGNTFSPKELIVGTAAAAHPGSLILASGALSTTFTSVASGAGSTGSLTVSGSTTLSVIDTLNVGLDGAGSLTVPSNATVNAGPLYVGRNIGSAGALSIPGGSVTCGDALIGFNAPGSLALATGGRLTGSYVAFGFDPPSSATGTLSGANTTLSATAIEIGRHAPASVSAGSGATIAATDVILGQLFLGHGSLTLADSGTALSTTGWLTIGSSGSGLLTVNNGATAHVTGVVNIGNVAAAYGQAVITGAGSRLDVDDNIWVGNEATGSMLISAGAGVESLWFEVGRLATSHGACQLTGANSTLDVGYDVNIGVDGFWPPGP